MPIESVHPEYKANYKTWCRINNVLNGEAKQYIPNIEPIYWPGHELYNPNSHYVAINSCKKYRERAIFTNFSAQTLDAVVGLALSAPPTLQDFPPQLDYLEKDSTGNKLTLDQLKQSLVRQLVSVGRTVLFTDYPNVAPGLSKLEQTKLKLGPRMFAFPAEAVDNWDTMTINGVEVLSMVKIKKQVRVSADNDPFLHKYETAYLVLRLIKDEGSSEYYYVQSTVSKDGRDIVSPFPVIANGKKLNKIPITFLGSRNNDPAVDPCPLESIVELNIGHLRNSAIYEDNLVKYGRGTLNITSALPSEEWQEYYQNRPIVLGTEEGYFLGPPGGEMSIVQLQPAQEAAAAMNQKQEQMLLNGAHLVINKPTNISAETTVLNMSDQLSVLNTIICNVEDAINEHIGYCAQFVGLEVQEGPYINLSREFIKKAAEPQVMANLLAAMNGGALPTRILLQYYQNVGIIAPDEDLEAIEEEAKNQNPLLGVSPLPNDNVNV